MFLSGSCWGTGKLGVGKEGRREVGPELALDKPGSLPRECRGEVSGKRSVTNQSSLLIECLTLLMMEFIQVL